MSEIELVDEMLAGLDKVAVKPLEWVKHPEVAAWRADTFLGLYQVWAVKGISWEMAARESIGGKAESIDAAFSAAQADYERRIRSALAPNHIGDANEMVQPAPVAKKLQEMQKALEAAAEDFALIEMRLRDKQPERALGAAMCGQKDARYALKGSADDL